LDSYLADGGVERLAKVLLVQATPAAADIRSVISLNK
jgi:hypothetical protein